MDVPLGPWALCACGHSMLLHDVGDMAGNNQLCCVDGCDQRGCGLSDADHYDVSCDDRPDCRIVEHHAGDV